MSAIVLAQTPQDFAVAKALLIEYRDTALAEDYLVGGSSLNEELESFPGPYVPPSGMLLLAQEGGEYLGCLALRPISKEVGEVMRMYVKPAARGKGIAEMLMRELLTRAKAAGYKTLYLDSLHKFKAAHRLYEKLGFTNCAPYDPATTDAMKEQMVFMTLDL